MPNAHTSDSLSPISRPAAITYRSGGVHALRVGTSRPPWPRPPVGSSSSGRSRRQSSSTLKQLLEADVLRLDCDVADRSY